MIKKARELGKELERICLAYDQLHLLQYIEFDLMKDIEYLVLLLHLLEENEEFEDSLSLIHYTLDNTS